MLELENIAEDRHVKAKREKDGGDRGHRQGDRQLPVSRRTKDPCKYGEERKAYGSRSR
jgi:hypothetical protein